MGLLRGCLHEYPDYCYEEPFIYKYNWGYLQEEYPRLDFNSENKRQMDSRTINSL